MILQKEQNAASGFSTKYHVIDTLNLRGNQLRCHLESYVDKPYVITKKPANYYSFNFTVTEQELETPVMALVVQKIGELPEWAGIKEVDETATTDEVIDETATVEEETE